MTAVETSLLARAPSLRGRHAVVTGAGRGIGWAIASALAGQGADLTLLGRDHAALERRRSELAGAPGRIGTDTADLRDPPALVAALERAAEARGAPTILVNNAGIAPSAPFGKQSLAGWNDVLAIDLTAAFVASQQVLPGMLASGGGRIVNIASTAGLTGYRYVAAYCAAKHGLVGLTRALALELARTGITVNAVCPGFTDTDLIAGAVEQIAAKSGKPAESVVAELTRANPQGRLIAPDEVAAAVVYLCSDAARGVTGQALSLSGGEVMP